MALPVRLSESQLRDDKQDNLVGGPGQSRQSARGTKAVVDLISINLPDVMVMKMTMFVMKAMRGDRPRRKGEAVYMTAGKERAVAWVKRCRRGRGGVHISCLP